MLLLDTNIISALMLPQPPPPVMDLARANPAERMVTAAICQAEILAGLAIMPAGARRQRLQAAAQALFQLDLSGHVLPFDQECAVAYAEVVTLRRRAGRPIAPFDAMIAAIARVHDATVVTRNAADFDGCGVGVLNPWSA